MVKPSVETIDHLILIPGKFFSHFLRGSPRNSPRIRILNHLPTISNNPSKQPGHSVLIFTRRLWISSGSLDGPTLSLLKELSRRKWQRRKFFSSSTGAGHRLKLLRSDYGGISGLRDGGWSYCWNQGRPGIERTW
ncbi:hypothetical protein O181_006063 [Austropuccinia psidii MF-1]|uniref:Uncharacterized protein n=1 Tax=Austropuccinia psidii MF-1 TaxID=1389203 RepID=A0A9Q3BJR3_9BASI|nr:hypothetical protein [Austropuccinia psidii MF-1]